MITLGIILGFFAIIFLVITVVIISGGITGLAIVLDVVVAFTILALLFKLIIGKK